MRGAGAPLTRCPQPLWGCLGLPAHDRAGHQAGGTCTDTGNTQSREQECAGGSVACLGVSGVSGDHWWAGGSVVCPGVSSVLGNQWCPWWAELPAPQFPPGLSSSQLMGLPMTQQSSLAPASPPSTFPPSPIPRYLARSSRRSFACLCLAWAFWASAEGKHCQGSTQPHQASSGAHRVQHHWSTTTSWHPPCLGRGLAAGDGEGRLLRGVTSFECPAAVPRELLASGGAPSAAAGTGGWLPWGSVSAEQGAAAWTGTGWPVAWGNASSLGCSVPGGLGGPGGDRLHWGGRLCAEVQFLSV